MCRARPAGPRAERLRRNERLRSHAEEYARHHAAQRHGRRKGSHRNDFHNDHSDDHGQLHHLNRQRRKLAERRRRSRIESQRRIDRSHWRIFQRSSRRWDEWRLRIRRRRRVGSHRRSERAYALTSLDPASERQIEVR